MKRAYKITWISLASVLGVIIIALGIAMYLLLNSNRLTALVNKYGSKFITCDYKIGKVDLTLFKTFPDIGLEISDLVLINPTEGCNSDTVASINQCTVSLNIKKLLFEDEVIINSCQLDGGYINVFYDKEGKSNLDIFPPSEPGPESGESTNYSFDLDQIKLNNVKLLYNDMSDGTKASIDGLCMDLKGKLNDEIFSGDLSLKLNNMMAEMRDSTLMLVDFHDMTFKGDLEIKGDDISTNADITAGKFYLLMQDEIDTIDVYMDDAVLKYNGMISNFEYLKGLADLNARSSTVIMDSEKYVDKAKIYLNTPVECDINKYAIAFGMMTSSLNLPINFDISKYKARLDGSKGRYNDIDVTLSGEISMADDIYMNLDIETEYAPIPKLIKVIPESMRVDLEEGITTSGMAQLKMHVEGIYSDDLMPVVIADVVVKDAAVEMEEGLPYPISNINTTFHAYLDLNKKSDVVLNSFDAKMNNSKFALEGSINDVFDKMLCNLNIKADVNFNDVKDFLPEELLAAGILNADVNLKGSVDQLMNLDLMNTKIDGKLHCKNLDINYSDTINLVSSDLKLDFTIPNPAKNNLRNGLAHVKITGSDLDADVTGTMTAMLDDFNIEAQFSNILDENAIMSVITDFGFNRIDFDMDDMTFHSDNVNGSAFMLPSANDGKTSYAAVYSSDSLVFSMGDDMNIAAEAIALDVSTDYDETEEDVFLQWNPILGLNVSNVVIVTSELDEDLFVPDIDLTYDEEGLNINNSQIILGNSDFGLKGSLTNVYSYFKDNELLKGEFTFTSDYTDVNELMDIFNGMGTEEAVTEQVNDTVVKEDEPFMVPQGVEIMLHTVINNASAGKMEIHNVGGDLTIKDGILVLQEMGFTSDAAKMQLTAIYKSKRKNHLYLGFDFHLLDIDIAEMIRIIPDLDTIVPMLSSFAGNAEFHFAAETNLKSDYSLKYSTLKAACSIEGKDLVVLDSETFEKIKKKLFFSKKTANKIDSLDVQFTVFKNEIDVYPFSVSMDKYSAMLYGRHNLDMSFDYNIAVLSPPILNRLGLEIKGSDLDNLKFKVRRSRHRNMFKPEKRDYKEEKIAEIKQIISKSLKDNVK